MQTRKWQDNQGQDRYTTEVVVQGFQGVMQMIGSTSGSNGGQQKTKQHSNQGDNQQQNQGGYNQNQQSPPHQQRQMSPQQGFNEPSADFDDDIPF